MSFNNARLDYEKAISLDPTLTPAKAFLSEISDLWYKIKQDIEKGVWIIIFYLMIGFFFL
jgi:hypothetical protein